MTNGTSIKDRYGLTLTTESQKAADHYVEGLDLFMAQSYGPDLAFEKALEADESLAVAHAISALLQMYRNDIAGAKETSAHAKTLAVNTTRRERQQVETIDLMINGDNHKAFRLIREHLKEFPRDALMLRLANRILILGCSGAGIANFPDELLALLKTVESDYGDDWAFLGQYAFAHHETEQFEEARGYAERSLEMRPDNANASHSVAHVYFETGDADSGSDFLGEWLTGYDSRAPFHVHLSWHQALFQLATGRYQKAKTLYENDIRPTVIKKNLGSLADSASLMWRMKIYGNAAPTESWEEVREIALPAAEKPGPAFRDGHAALVFAAGGYGEDIGRMIDGLGDMANDGNALANEVTLPLVKGIDAFAHGSYQDAADLLGPLCDQLPRIGGSHAQREVFEDTILESYIRAEQFDKAQDLLHTRLKRRTSVRDTFWLGRTQLDSDQDEASSNLNEAGRLWSDADADSPEVSRLNEVAGQIG